MMKNRATCGFLSVTVVIALLVMALGVAAVVLFSRGSLGEKMNLIGTQDDKVDVPIVIVVTATPAPIEKLAAVEVVAEPAATATVTAATVAATATPTVEPAAAKEEGMCGTRGSLLLLLIGTDFSEGVWPEGADAVRVIKVDYDQNKVTMVAFPRDLWLKTDGLENQNIYETRLGLAYHYMRNATMGSDKHRTAVATTLVGQTLYNTFGIAPQTYFTLQLNNTAEMVDAMDGVDIYNPQSFTSDYGMYFPQGQQHLDGKQALEFVRTYKPGGDDVRRQRQDLFMDAMQKTLINAGLIANLPDLYKQFDKAVTTDLSPKMIAELACMMERVPEDRIEIHEVAGDLVTPINVGDRIPALQPKVNEVKIKLYEWLGE